MFFFCVGLFKNHAHGDRSVDHSENLIGYGTQHCGTFHFCLTFSISDSFEDVTL